MFDAAAPEKVFKGTWKEVLSHRDEIEEDSNVEVRVWKPQLSAGGQDESLADDLEGLLEEAKNLQKGEPIRYDDPHTQRVVELIREDLKRQGLKG